MNKYFELPPPALADYVAERQLFQDQALPEIQAVDDDLFNNMMHAPHAPAGNGVFDADAALLQDAMQQLAHRDDGFGLNGAGVLMYEFLNQGPPAHEAEV